MQTHCRPIRSGNMKLGYITLWYALFRQLRVLKGLTLFHAMTSTDSWLYNYDPIRMSMNVSTSYTMPPYLYLAGITRRNLTMHFFMAYKFIFIMFYTFSSINDRQKHVIVQVHLKVFSKRMCDYV